MQPSANRRFRSESLALLAVQCLLAVLVGGMLARERAGLHDAEFDRLHSQAKVVDENFIRHLEGADKALKGVVRQIAPADAPLDPRAVSAQLKLLTDAMAGVNSMVVTDADGLVVAVSGGKMLGLNLKERGFFKVPKRQGDPSKLYLLPPYHRSNGDWMMLVSRIRPNAAGGFGGVVTAELDPVHFAVLLRSVLYAPDMHAALIHQDGGVFLDVSGDPAAPAPSPRRPGSGGGQASSPSVAERATAAATPRAGVEDRQAVSVHTLERGELHLDKPMVVEVSRDFAALRAPWHTKVWQFAGLWAGLAAASAVALWVIQRRRREATDVAEAIARERQAGSARVEQALRGADLGLWELHVPSDTFVINDRERELLGYPPDAELPQGPAWRALIHPDDRAGVDAAIVPHLKGKAPNYECEHRMRHRDGHDVWLFSRAMIVERDARGMPVRIVGTHLDISARRQVEQRLADTAARLRDSEEELRLLTDNMPALVSRLDPAQRFRYANRAYADWLQLDCASLIGRSLEDVYGSAAYASFREHIERALTGVRVNYERDLATPTGSRRVEFTLVPQFDAGGAVKGLYTLATDITARHQAESRLARSEERLSLALDGSGLALFDWNLQTQTVFHSAQAAALRGEMCGEVTTPIAEQQQHVHPDDLANVLVHARDTVAGRTPLYSVEFRLRCLDGDWLWVRASGRVVQRDPLGRALRLAGTYTDIHARKIAEGRLRQLAEFDALTGLPNRALFGDRLQQAMARAARGTPLALLYLDIDHFKGINDTLGHETGDTVLKVYARRMQAVVRESDTVARLAGDEFTIILEGVRGSTDASMIAAKLVEALGQPIALAGGELHATASIGVAMCEPGETDAAALLRRADAALYEAKRRGRNSSFCTQSDLQPQHFAEATA